jgi:hypothetical protein
LYSSAGARALLLLGPTSFHGLGNSAASLWGQVPFLFCGLPNRRRCHGFSWSRLLIACQQSSRVLQLSDLSIDLAQYF